MTYERRTSHERCESAPSELSQCCANCRRHRLRTVVEHIEERGAASVSSSLAILLVALSIIGASIWGLLRSHNFISLVFFGIVSVVSLAAIGYECKQAVNAVLRYLESKYSDSSDDSTTSSDERGE